MHFSKKIGGQILTRRLAVYPLYFLWNELRLCIRLRILGLNTGLTTKIKTNLQIFQKIQKTRPNVCKIVRPFSAAYSSTEHYLQRESSPLQVLPWWCIMWGGAVNRQPGHRARNLERRGLRLENHFQYAVFKLAFNLTFSKIWIFS